MAIPEDRLSTTVISADWLPPDERARQLDEDYEQGPIALNDTSEGINYQPWHLTYNVINGEMTATPETSGSPVVVLTVLGVTQLSFCFDQNAHVNVAYTTLSGQTYLYWYDTVLGNWTTTTLPSAVFCPTLTMDDKRPTQTTINDFLLWWTEEQLDATYTLYSAQQRDRFDPLVPREMAQDVYPYIYKCGMNKGLRVQLGLSDRIL